jgi:hypothetical protein
MDAGMACLATGLFVATGESGFIRQLPGRKNDVKDAQWIAECLQRDTVKGSFVPDEVLRQMRQYSRRYRYLTKNRVRAEQRMDNHLQRCNIHFNNYVSSQGKNVSIRKKSLKTLHRNRYLRTMPVEISWSAARSNRTFPGKKYSHLSKRMKSQKALPAITLKIPAVICNVLKTGQLFDPKRNIQAVLPD